MSDVRIFVVGYWGLVGFVIVWRLDEVGYLNVLMVSCNDVDLCD